MSGVTLDGFDDLNKRFLAIRVAPKQVLGVAQVRTTQLARLAAPVATGRMAASIKPGRLTSKEALVRVTTVYARYIERGTGLYGPFGRAYDIVPKNGKVLAWPTTRSASTKAGGFRKSALRGRKAPIAGRIPGGATPKGMRIRMVRGQRIGPSAGPITYAKRVRHPGIRPQPFLMPSARQALRETGLDEVVQLWDNAV